MNEVVVHLAYRRVAAPREEPPEPRSAVCAGDAVGYLDYDIENTTCERCIDTARRRWML